MDQSSDLMQSQSLDETGLALTTRSTIVSSSSGVQRSMSVLRRQQEGVAAPSDAKALPMFVAGHGIGQTDTEISYNLNPQARDFGPESQHAQDIAKLTPLHYKTEEGKQVKIPLTTRRIRLALRFFNESP